MSMILYTETNFILSYATGRSTATDRLISNPPLSIRIVMPSPCFMEALSVLEGERKRQRKFANDLGSEITQAKRNLVSPKIRIFINHLQASLFEFQSMASDLEARLIFAIGTLCTKAILIEPTAAIINSSFARAIINDPTDNLILACIISHSSAHPGETKLFLTENRKCFFDNPYSMQELQAAGIQYFSDASRCLDWINSQPASSNGPVDEDRDDSGAVEV